MLESVKISRRQSEIRQVLAGLAGNASPSDDDLSKIEGLDKEYRGNETRYRAALIAEDSERREAGAELETRGGREWSDLVSGFELRQVALALDEGHQLTGKTAEVVTELRSRGGYRGVPVPWLALERRAGETVAAGVPDPTRTAPIIDRLFADSVAAKMGAAMLNIDQGIASYPVVTSSVAAGWAASETGAVAGPTVFATTDKPLSPDSTLGVQMKVTRKALKQSGDALEAAVRRDMSSAIGVALDKAVFLGAGSGGEPAGVLVGSYGIASTALNDAASWSAFRAAIVRFMVANAITAPSGVKLLIRPEVFDSLDEVLIEGTAVSQWDRLTAAVPAGNVVLSSNAIAAPTGTPAASTALLTTNVGGVAPIFCATWGAIDLIRDPYADAASGGLRLTALVTADLTVARPAQLQIVTGVQ